MDIITYNNNNRRDAVVMATNVKTATAVCAVSVMQFSRYTEEIQGYAAARLLIYARDDPIIIIRIARNNSKYTYTYYTLNISRI